MHQFSLLWKDVVLALRAATYIRKPFRNSVRNLHTNITHMHFFHTHMLKERMCVLYVWHSVRNIPFRKPNVCGRLKCGKSRMYFCYTCYVPVPLIKEHVPVCKLPVKVDIIKHKREIDGKSTAAHAAVLAPLDVNIYIYPDIPKYELDNRTVLLYPGVDASTIQELFTGKKKSVSYSEHLLAELPQGYNVGTLMKKITSNASTFEIFHVKELPVDRVVLIDSTWNQSRGIFADERLQKMPKIVVQNRASQFWRHQRGSPRWYLSTIEALHQLLLELHICAWGLSDQYSSELTLQYPVHKSDEDHSHCKPYSGQYDNLMFFFKFMYEKLHILYKHEDLLAYKRPMS